MEIILRVYSGANVACQVCVRRQLQACYTSAGTSASRWALVKSSVALHGVCAPVGSRGETNLWLEKWQCSLLTAAAEDLHWTARHLGTGHGYVAFLHCLGTSGLLSVVQLGRFSWSGLCLGCNWEVFVCASLSCQIVHAEVGEKILWWCSSCIRIRIIGN